MRSIVIGTAGHIDHGKSAVVKALTGTDPDRLKEERERGITIDLGFAHLQTGNVDLAFVDVPGHERFVKNMLAGAGGIDLVMLVVAADESVMPQTREHFEICRLLHVPAGVIVLTKTDLADRDTVELAALEVRELVRGSFLADAPVVGVSSRTGDGLDKLRATLSSLAETVPVRPVEGAARLPIDRVFSIKGFGTVVTGTLVSGCIRMEQELVALPPGRTVKVRGVQIHGQRVTEATAGNRVALNLGGVDVSDLARGHTLCEPGAFESTRRFDALLDLISQTRPLRHGARVRVHCGTSEVLGRVAVASARDGNGPIAEVPAGGSVYARIRLESPAVVTRGDRYILRAYSPAVTIGGGVIIDPAPPRGAIRTPAGLARFARLDPGREGLDATVTYLVEERGASGFPRQALISRVGLDPRSSAAVVERLVTAGRVLVVGDRLLAPAAVSDLSTRLIAALRAHHASQPLSEGLPREEARDRLFGRAAPAVFEFVLDRLVREERLVARERLALAGHQLSLSSDESQALTKLEHVYREAKLAPPDLATAIRAAGTSPAVGERVVTLLLRNRTLVKIESLLFHGEVLEQLKADVRRLKEGSQTPRVDVAAFKERYGVTRKYAIPLLEYLDRERVTRRVGDGRLVL